MWTIDTKNWTSTEYFDEERGRAMQTVRRPHIIDLPDLCECSVEVHEEKEEEAEEGELEFWYPKRRFNPDSDSF
jgi:hypothetical protein